MLVGLFYCFWFGVLDLVGFGWQLFRQGCWVLVRYCWCR